MSDSEAVMTAPAAVQEEGHDQGVQGYEPAVHPPSFRELQEQIKEALAAYKQRQAAIANIRESLSKARKTEADC
jgi:molecular chaperone GrpE (heat shock protein)